MVARFQAKGSTMAAKPLSQVVLALLLVAIGLSAQAGAATGEASMLTVSLAPDTLQASGNVTISIAGPCAAATAAVAISNSRVTGTITIAPPGSPDAGSGSLTLYLVTQGSNFYDPYFTDVTTGDHDVVVSAAGCDYPTAVLHVLPGLPSHLTLHKTVGTDPGTCASESTLTVPAGTRVYYCYTLVNDSENPAAIPTTHALQDDQLGPLLDDGTRFLRAEFNYSRSFAVLPGQSVTTVELGVVASAVPSETTTNTAIWYAGIDQRLGHYLPVWMSASASATVVVTPPVAEAVDLRPTFTG
jgi:hypothetical protein